MPLTAYIYMDEQVRCNICGVSIDVSKAKEHAALQSHAEQKARLEGELNAAKGTPYDHDSSVAGRWAATTTTTVNATATNSTLQ
jgi:hypothetical protein